MLIGLLVTCILETSPILSRFLRLGLIYLYSTSSSIMRNMYTKYHQHRQACQSDDLLHIFRRLCPTLPRRTVLGLIYPCSTSRRLMRNMGTKFHQNRQHVIRPISNMYFGDFATPHPEGLDQGLFTPTVLHVI
ncbi:hypothetical protein AVEN_274258-1 [Araneus ventricosus]|uniref:Uncharacterized protein n=1 Tax=Araneus ventricosus TaxID=182803 RepID=A0A4Y2I464_ARAVE|nr:hypothetical protein AVEN_274258-1 [Araneus ventricosus]